MELASVPRVHATRVRAAAMRTVVGLSVGAILIVTFLRLVNVSGVYQHLAHLRLDLMLLCGAAFLAAYVVRALRWRCLLRPYEVGIGRTIAIYQVATFVNWLLPVRGGELVKSFLLRRLNGIPVGHSLATISMDKAMDLLPAVALIALLPILGFNLSRPLWLLLIFALVVVGSLGLIFVLVAWKRRRTLSLLSRVLGTVLPMRLRDRVEPFLVQFIDTLLTLIRQPRLMLLAAGYTALAVCLDALFCLLAFRAVGVAISVPVVLYGYTFYNLAFILPTPPGQVGSNELVGLLIFSGLFGLGRSGVGAMFVFSHPWTAILMTCSGLFCLSRMGLSLRTTLRLASDQPAEGPA